MAFDGWRVTRSMFARDEHRPRLASIPVTFAIRGDRDHVEATIDVAGTGELWRWAGIVKLTDLRFAFAASTLRDVTVRAAGA